MFRPEIKCATPCWRNLKPERLFIQGFRNILNGYHTGDAGIWSDAWNIYAKELGTVNGRRTFDTLWVFTQTYRQWAHHPIKFHQANCPCLCRDECFALALISAMQTQDGNCARRCLELLFKAEGTQVSEEAAFRVGADFISVGQRFLPVGLSVVEEVLAQSLSQAQPRSQAQTLPNKPAPTLH